MMDPRIAVSLIGAALLGVATSATLFGAAPADAQSKTCEYEGLVFYAGDQACIENVMNVCSPQGRWESLDKECE
jgi:hypothetical protein